METNGTRIACDTCGIQAEGYGGSTCTANAMKVWNRRPKQNTAEEIISDLESRGLGWDIGHTGRLRECRIWDWPHVVGRYRPNGQEPLAEQLTKAIADMDAGGINANP